MNKKMHTFHISNVDLEWIDDQVQKGEMLGRSQFIRSLLHDFVQRSKLFTTKGAKVVTCNVFEADCELIEEIAADLQVSVSELTRMMIRKYREVLDPNAYFRPLDAPHVERIQKDSLTKILNTNSAHRGRKKQMTHWDERKQELLAKIIKAAEMKIDQGADPTHPITH